MDLLKKSAIAWRNLCNFSYIITYGKKGKLHNVNIIFGKSDFYHLAGFQYLRDIGLPINFSHSKYIDLIFNNRITENVIKSGGQYEKMVKPRLKALIDLQETLDKNINLYNYNSSKYFKFYTTIKADMFIYGENNNNKLYIFLKDREDKYICSSIFLREERDYRENQTPFKILKLIKINLETGQENTLIDKLC